MYCNVLKFWQNAERNTCVFSDVLVKVGDVAVFSQRGLFIDFAYINNRACSTMPGALLNESIHYNAFLRNFSH